MKAMEHAAKKRKSLLFQRWSCAQFVKTSMNILWMTYLNFYLYSLKVSLTTWGEKFTIEEVSKLRYF